MSKHTVLALDLGRRMGWAIGNAGARPDSGAHVLGDSQAEQAGTLIAWLQEVMRAGEPELVIKEAALSLAAFKKLNNSEASVRAAYGRDMIVEGMCHRFGIRCQTAKPSQIRRHFIGKAHAGDRESTKRAVIVRCRQLGYVEPLCRDDDMCDALAAWDLATSVMGKPGAFRLLEGV